MKIEQLKRWAELEPERCHFYGADDIVCESPGFSQWDFGIDCLSPQMQAVLCGMIEAAIIERGDDWWFNLEYCPTIGSHSAEWSVYVYVWDANLGDGRQFTCKAPTKLEALLSAYLLALEKTK